MFFTENELHGDDNNPSPGFWTRITDRDLRLCIFALTQRHTRAVLQNLWQLLDLHTFSHHGVHKCIPNCFSALPIFDCAIRRGFVSLGPVMTTRSTLTSPPHLAGEGANPGKPQKQCTPSKTNLHKATTNLSVRSHVAFGDNLHPTCLLSTVW